jgi:hypothetical protein
LIVVDDFGIASPKTKDFIGAIGTLGLIENKKRAKTLIIDSLDNANLILSSRNVQKTKVTNSFGLNIYDIIYHEKLVFSKAAVEELNNLLDPGKEKGETEIAPAVEEKPKAKRAAKPKAEPEAATEEAPAPKKRTKKEASPKKEVTNNE